MFNVDYPNRTFAPAMQCIYCGSTTGLTKEHIVPYGIAGNSMVLEKASCTDCARVTSQLEGSVLESGLAILREKFQAPTRHKNRRTGRQSRWIVNRDPDGTIRPTNTKREFSTSELPAICVFPIFHPPRLFSADKSQADWTGQFFVWRDEFAVTLLESGTALHLGKVHPAMFARFLAKIAHGIACAEIGLKGFDAFLPPVILSDRNDPFEYVGACLDPLPVATDTLHAWDRGIAELGLERYVIVKIRLFAMLGTPEYLVVAGKMAAPSNEAPSSG